MEMPYEIFAAVLEVRRQDLHRSMREVQKVTVTIAALLLDPLSCHMVRDATL